MAKRPPSKRGQGRKKGSRNALPVSQSVAVKALRKVFDKYGIPDNIPDPIAFLKEKGYDNPVALMVIDNLLKLAMGRTMPRNALAKAQILRELGALFDVQPPSKPQEHRHTFDFLKLVEESIREEEESNG